MADPSEKLTGRNSRIVQPSFLFRVGLYTMYLYRCVLSLYQLLCDEIEYIALLVASSPYSVEA